MSDINKLLKHIANVYVPGAPPKVLTAQRMIT